MLNHETVLAVHFAVVIIEHPDIFFPLLDNKIFSDYVLSHFFRAAEQGRH
jgi:hypothetical protein